jgi:protein phosphatase
VDLLDNIDVESGEFFLLCTDGMSQVNDDEIQSIILSNPPQQACENLVELANIRGGEDNVTVMIIKIVGGQ